MEIELQKVSDSLFAFITQGNFHSADNFERPVNKYKLEMEAETNC